MVHTHKRYELFYHFPPVFSSGNIFIDWIATVIIVPSNDRREMKRLTYKYYAIKIPHAGD